MRTGPDGCCSIGTTRRDVLIFWMIGLGFRGKFCHFLDDRYRDMIYMPLISVLYGYGYLLLVTLQVLQVPWLTFIFSNYCK
jgi:hypothetical protein